MSPFLNSRFFCALLAVAATLSTAAAFAQTLTSWLPDTNFYDSPSVVVSDNFALPASSCYDAREAELTVVGPAFPDGNIVLVEASKPTITNIATVVATPSKDPALYAMLERPIGASSLYPGTSNLKFQPILFVFEAQFPTVDGQFTCGFCVRNVAM